MGTETPHLCTTPLARAGREGSPLDGRTSTRSCGVILWGGSATPSRLPPPCAPSDVIVSAHEYYGISI